jgi:hypothetical protein
VSSNPGPPSHSTTTTTTPYRYLIVILPSSNSVWPHCGTRRTRPCLLLDCYIRGNSNCHHNQFHFLTLVLPSCLVPVPRSRGQLLQRFEWFRQWGVFETSTDIPLILPPWSLPACLNNTAKSQDTIARTWLFHIRAILLRRGTRRFRRFERCVLICTCISWFSNTDSSAPPPSSARRNRLGGLLWPVSLLAARPQS